MEGDEKKVEVDMVTVAPENIQYVFDPKGKTKSVIVDIKVWRNILEALEEAEDIAIAKEALGRLDAAGGDYKKAGFISLDEALAEMEQPHAQK
jgi:predicted DNA-binding protein